MSRSSVILDSSAWIEVFGSGPLAKQFEKEIKNASEVIVPTLVIFEVYRKILKSSSEDQALSSVAVLKKYFVADLTQEIALLAGDLSLEHKLATADSLVLAHAKHSQATLVTMDNDFSGINNVRILRNKK